MKRTRNIIVLVALTRLSLSLRPTSDSPSLEQADAQRWNREELRERVRELKGLPQCTTEQTCPKCGRR